MSMNELQKQTNANIQAKANLIWEIATHLVGLFKPHEYGKVILPMTVLKRFDDALKPTKAAVVEMAKKLDAQHVEGAARDGILCRVSGYDFYNTSNFDFVKLIADPDDVEINFEAYLQGFSSNIKDIIDNFDFANTVKLMVKGGVLFVTLQEFNSNKADMSPDKITSADMGYIFEELIRKFSESYDEQAGAHFTSRDIIYLMTELLVAPEKAEIMADGCTKTAYDMAMGTSQMLGCLTERLQSISEDASLTCFGQEFNPETYAIAKADMLIKGGNASGMKYGDTLSDDAFSGYEFDYIISNPPFGIDWKREKAQVENEAKRGFDGRFGPGLPAISDGQMLFMLNGVKKLKEGSGRMAIIQNGSSLFTGDAGSGASEIRRYVIEGDLVEAIIQLPTDLFYNTGISTYIWVLTKGKAMHRSGKVHLIDASKCFVKRRKNIGSKRVDLDDACINLIIRAYEEFDNETYEESDLVVESKVFDNSFFGFTKVTVETAQADKDGKPVLKKGKCQPVKGASDSEIIPLSEDMDAYMQKNVLPYNPQAYIDPAKSKIGYEVPFTRLFYKFVAPVASADIFEEIKALEADETILMKELLHELTNRDLIVMGYSGRDQSLMNALQQVYSTKGAGKLFWCGYGTRVSSEVKALVEMANKNGRAAFYIPTEGFDSTMYAIARHCMSENREFLGKVDDIKKKLSITLEPQRSGFLQPNLTINKVVSTNAFPIAFPNQCYQFEVLFAPGEKQWDFCKMLGRDDVMAVPYKNLVYAWGSKSVIEEACKGKLKTNIELCPLSRATIAGNGTFRELLLKTLVHLLAASHGLGHSKDKIWDTKEVLKYRIGAKTVTAYSGVRLALLFDNKYSYLTLVPSFMYADDAVLTREEKKQFADWFNAKVNNGRPNQNANEHIRKWVRKVIGNKRFSANYPLGSTTNFTFSVVNSSALVGVNFGKQASIQLPDTISPKRIIFSGIEYRDPTLRFCGTSMCGVAEDFHPMRGLISNAPVDHAMNNGVLHSAISVGVVCPDEHNQKFAQFISGLNRQSQAKHNTDYLISFPGFYQAFKTGLDLPDPNSSKWKQITASSEWDVHKAAVEFGDSIIRKIDQLSANSIDVILIYIPKEYEVFTSYTDGTVNYDLHDYIKAYAAQKQVATQFVREKTIESDLHCQIMWALSLALYVKSGRTPWVVNGIQPDTAFAGIGYSVMNGPSGSNVVVGCSHIYSSDGRGMKYKLSKIQDYSFDRKKNPYLSEEEAYRIGLNIKELFYKSFSELPKRVVIHKRTPFRKEEIKGLVESLSSAGVRNIELLEITYEDNLKCFALNERCTQVDGYPVRRGMCFPIDKNTMYLFTHGIAPSVISSNRRYFQGGKSVPLPLKVVKHYGSGDMAQIATEILGLSKMNWNSFGLYSKLPCTIESSNEIARIGWLLSQFEGTLYDYRYFM